MGAGFRVLSPCPGGLVPEEGVRTDGDQDCNDQPRNTSFRRDIKAFLKAHPPESRFAKVTKPCLCSYFPYSF